jgi:hypothetical protein
LLEDKKYQPNMLTKMDFDKISDNVSVSNTELNHNTVIRDMADGLGYGP